MSRMPEELVIYLEDGEDYQDWYPELEEDDEDEYPEPERTLWEELELAAKQYEEIPDYLRPVVTGVK